MKPILLITLLFIPHLLEKTTVVLSSLETGGNETDYIALMAIKSQLIDHSPALGSWNHSLHHCDWQGVTCGHRHRRVTLLNLHSRGLVGTISPFIGNLSFLRKIDLFNNSLHGQIPSEIGRLFRLHSLHLENNTLSGEIPSNISGCVNLEFIGLEPNRLEGQLPRGIGALSKLKWLFLNYNNNLGGPLFDIIGNLTSLEQISITDCAFTGTIPGSIDRMRNLSLLELGTNQLSGMIPPSIFNLSNLYVLELVLDPVYGSVPLDIGFRLPKLQILNLAGNHLSGSLPSSIANLTNLEYLAFSQNNFRGEVSLDFRHLTNLQELDLFGNNLEGNLDFIDTLVNCSNLETLDLSINDFTGALPKSLANLSNTLFWLGLEANRLSGEILLGTLSNLINLEYISMNLNEFSGTIPYDLGRLQKLQWMHFSVNRLTGEIPNFFGNFSHLTSVFLHENKLQGSIPPSLGSCQSLLVLNLGDNDLTGPLPKELFGGLPKFLQLNLSQNQLQGPLPSNIDKQISLSVLDVSHNKLFGEIPNGLCKCLALELLSMGGNFFHGSIPPSFSSLKSLQEVNLSHNNLSGPIPNYFSTYPLEYLDLSYNNFEGKVPTNGIFANASAIFLVGNGKLCGGIPQLDLPRCMEMEWKRKRTPHSLQFIIPIVCIFIGAAIVTWVYLACGKKKRPVTPGSLMREAFFQVSYNMLLKATDGFSTEKLLGRGTFGSVFKGVLQPYGQIVAVKVLNVQLCGASKSFMAECKALRNIRHRNLVEIITACSSIDFQGNDFKALVYKFLPNGSLDKWLHEDGNLSLAQRVDIAIDIACALNYLHYDCEPPIVHCDLKPSNILLDDDMVAHLGDFGLAKFLCQYPNQNESSSIGIRGTVGYAAPEYGLGGEVATKGDVYSYGILLLELMTGKGPTDKMFKDDFNLHTYAEGALPDQVMQIVDPTLIEQDNEEVNKKGPVEATLKDKIGCMVAVIKIGVACSNMLPLERMRMNDVVNDLQKARGMISRYRQNLQRGS